MSPLYESSATEYSSKDGTVPVATAPTAGATGANGQALEYNGTTLRGPRVTVRGSSPVEVILSSWDAEGSSAVEVDPGGVGTLVFRFITFGF